MLTFYYCNILKSIKVSIQNVTCKLIVHNVNSVFCDFPVDHQPVWIVLRNLC